MRGEREERRGRRKSRGQKSKAEPGVHFHKGMGSKPMQDGTQVPCQLGEESSSATGFVLSEQLSWD